MLHKLFNIISNIILVICVVVGVAAALILFGGLNILSFIGRILTSPICWVLIGIVVIIAYWRHENS